MCICRCLASAALLAATAAWSQETLYVGTAAMGYSVAMQVGSGGEVLGSRDLPQATPGWLSRWT